MNDCNEEPTPVTRHLSFSGPESFARVCAEHYHWLRGYMYEHPEVAGILGVID